MSLGEARGTGGLKLADYQSLRFHSSMAGSPEEVWVKELHELTIESFILVLGEGEMPGAGAQRGIQTVSWEDPLSEEGMAWTESRVLVLGSGIC